MNLNEFGFEIGADNVTVQVLVTTQQQNIKKLEPELHSIENKLINVFYFYFIFLYLSG